MKFYRCLFGRSVVIVASTLCVLAIPSYGQDYLDVLRLNYGITGLNSFDDKSGRTRIIDCGIDTNIPLPLNSKAALLTGVVYEQVRTKLYHDFATQTFHGVGVKLGLSIKHNAQWTTTCLLLPRMSTDMVSINTRSWQFGGLLVVRKKQSEYMQYRIGLYMNSEQFGTWVVPLFGVYYRRPNRPWEVSIFLPVSLDVNYAITQGFRAGVLFAGQRRSYQLSAIPTYGGAGYLDRATNELGLYLSWQIASGLILQPRISHSLGRHYKVFAEHDKISMGLPLATLGDDRIQLNNDFADGWQGQVQLIYRIALNGR